VGFGDLRKLFISFATTLQYAVVCEARTRVGRDNNIVGGGTLVWLLCGAWNFHIFFSFLVLPGVIAFNPAAKEDPTYCAAWASACVSKMAIVLVVTGLFFNILTVLFWLLDVGVSVGSQEIMYKAKAFDNANMGIPVAQFLAKSFLVRGSTDVLTARFAVTVREKTELAREFEETKNRLNALKDKLSGAEKHEQKIQKQMEECGGTIEANVEKVNEKGGMDVESIRAKGEEVIVAAQNNAAEAAKCAQEAATEKIEELVEKLKEMVNTVMESDMFKDLQKRAEEAAIQAKEAAEQAKKMAEEAAEQAKTMAADAQKMAADGVEQAKKMAEEAQKMADEAAKMATDPEMVAKLRAAAEDAKKKAQAIAEDAQKQAVEAQKQAMAAAEGRAMASDAKRQGKELAAEAKAAALEAAEKAKQILKK